MRAHPQAGSGRHQPATIELGRCLSWVALGLQLGSKLSWKLPCLLRSNSLRFSERSQSSGKLTRAQKSFQADALLRLPLAGVGLASTDSNRPATSRQCRCVMAEIEAVIR